MILLSTAYLGNLQYYSKLLSGEAYIDLHEHYLKQSYRNRCDILSANGVLSLTVPVHHTGGVATPTCQIRIDYSKRWQHRHWQAIVSSYRGSPYFAHYEEHFAPLYQRRFDLLSELNVTLQQTILQLLDPSGEVATRINYTDEYIHPLTQSDAHPHASDCTPSRVGTQSDPETKPCIGNPRNPLPPTLGACSERASTQCTDLRLSLSPKPRLSRPDPTFLAPQYYQVFSDRLPFAENLSVIDLLFCEGPATAEILRASYLG